MREIIVVPSVVETIPEGLATIEAIGRDRLGGRVDVPVRWTSSDETIATVTPAFARHTVITGVAPGETRIVATHRTSGAGDTVDVTVGPIASVARLDPYATSAPRDDPRRDTRSIGMVDPPDPLPEHRDPR